MSTTELWQAWNHQIVIALHSGLSELAKDLDYQVPDVSLFRRYGTPHFKTTSLFPHVVINTGSLSHTPTAASEITNLKQLRRLQALLHLH
eukprot:1706531-Karenia_brevis.AAC.1